MPSWTTNNDDKMSSWRDQLSPRLMGFRGFRRASSESVAKTTSSPSKEFTMMHFPDRPARRITEADIPNDEECKRNLMNMRKASFAEQINRREHLKQLSPVQEPVQKPLTKPPQIEVPQIEEPRIEEPQPEQPRIEQRRAQQPLRLTFGPFNGSFRSAFGPLTPAEEEPCPLERVDTKDSTLQIPESSVDIRSSILAADGFNFATEPSPQPVVISEAKTIRLERVDNMTPGASPISSPRPSDASASGWPRRKQSVQMVAIRRASQDSQKRKQSVQTVIVRRPSKPVPDALSSNPVNSSAPTQVHVRQDSVSDPMCRLCHSGIAEKSGVCSSCDNESTPATPVEISPNFSRLHQKPTVKRYNRPPPLIPQSLDGIASLHRPSASLTSDPEANQPSPPPSPRSPGSSTGETVRTPATGPSVPPTPMSALSTPEVFKRFQEEVELRAKADDSPAFDDPWMIKSKNPDVDVYADDWADYYFDEQNFTPGDENDKTQGIAPSVHEFPSPVNPGPGWI
ncbi:hypothetical protein FSARC_8468 [Fusarium sarcochroum]|uniref:Uncharacterized protein n=1 Tax=Fusarium sarcochroum TaxID=1208366 RepID=A0A8H4TSU3_9HYPO|nr:hypothetical protein FSARC_8468 [Fusarium sarcochroum]